MTISGTIGSISTGPCSWVAAFIVALALWWPLGAVASSDDNWRKADHFSSNGTANSDWIWLSDGSHSQFGEFVFDAIPATDDIHLKFNIAASMSEGLHGAHIDLLFGYPGSGGMGGVFQVVPIVLEPTGRVLPGGVRLTSGEVVLSRQAVKRTLPTSGVLYLRIVRHDATVPIVGVKADSILLLVSSNGTDDTTVGTGASGSDDTGVPPPLVRFNSTGEQVDGWFWLRDPQRAQIAEFTFRVVPTTGDLTLRIDALATNEINGPGGTSARVRLLYGPVQGRSASKIVTLPNISPPGDSLGYQVGGTVTLKRKTLDNLLRPDEPLFVRIERVKSNDPHIAFNGRSVDIVPSQHGSDTVTPPDSGFGGPENGSGTQHLSVFSSNGDEIQGWYWLRDPGLKQVADFVIRSLPESDEVTLRIDALATTEVSGPGGTPARFGLWYGPENGRGSLKIVTLPNISPPDDPLGYQVGGEVVLPRDDLDALIRPSEPLLIRLQRVKASDPHVAFNAQSLRILTSGADGATSSLSTPQEGTTLQDGTLPRDGPSIDATSADDAMTLDPGIYHGQLDVGQDRNANWTRIALSGGQILQAHLTTPSTLSASMLLRTEQGSTLEEIYVPPGQSGVIRRAASTDGTFLIKIVRSHSSGAYGLEIKVVDQDDAGYGFDAPNDRQEALSIDTGGLSGELLRGDDIDWYALTLDSGDIIELDLVAPETGRLSVDLRTPTGLSRRNIATTGQGIAHISYAADSAGDWLIGVRRQQGHGIYELTVDRQSQSDGGAPGDATDIRNDARVLPEGPQYGQLLAADNRDIYFVEAERGDVIELSAHGQTDSLKMALSLLSPGGSSVESAGLRPQEQAVLRHAATVEGNWYADVKRSSGAGPYQIEATVTPQDDGGNGRDAGTCSSELAVMLSIPVTDGRMLRGDEVDCYALTLAENETIHVVLHTDGDLTTPVLELRSGSSWLASGQGDAVHEGTALDYASTRDRDAVFLRVGRRGGDGPYRLEVSFTPPRGGIASDSGAGQSASEDETGSPDSEQTGPSDDIEPDAADTTVDQVLPAIHVNLADGGRRIVSDRPFRVEAGGIGDTEGDGDGLDQGWEDLAAALVSPQWELDEEEDWLTHRAVDQFYQLTRVTPYSVPGRGEFVLFYFISAWTRDYGRFAVGVTSFDDDVAQAHNGDLERVIYAYRITSPTTLDLEWVYTSAHGGETQHEGVWSAHGESCANGKVKLGPDEIICATLQFVDNRLRLQASEDKHAVYPTAEACEDVHLVGRMSLSLADAMSGETTGFGEDCGGGGTFVMPIVNVGEPPAGVGSSPASQQSSFEVFDLSTIFAGQTLWGGEEFCGGMSYTLDPHLRCTGGSVKDRFSSVPGLLKDRLGGSAGPRRPDPVENIGTTLGNLGDAAGTVLGEAGDRVETTVDQVLDILPDLPSLPNLPF